MTIDDQGPEPVGLSPSFASSRAPAPGSLVDMRAAWIDFYDAHYHRVVRFVMRDGACLDDARDAAVGFTEDWRLLFVVHLIWEDDTIRIISARPATAPR